MQYQDRTTNVTQYHDKFKNMVDVIEHCGGTVVDGMVLMAAIREAIAAEDLDIALIAEKIEEVYNDAKEQQMACAFILSADRARFGRLIEELENSFVEGNDRFPKTLEAAHKRLEYWKQDPRNLTRAVGADTEGVAFAQNGDSKKVVDVTQITCFHCNEKGHYANKCPKREQESEGQVHTQTEEKEEVKTSTGYTHMQMEEDLLTSFQFCMVVEEQEHRNYWREPLLCKVLEYQRVGFCWTMGPLLMFSVIRTLLENVREVQEHMRIKCNAGVTVTNMMGDLPGYGPVWYNPDGIANILSLSRVGEKYRITYDSGADAGFKIHKPDGTIRLFRRSSTGLFYIDTDTQGISTC